VATYVSAIAVHSKLHIEKGNDQRSTHAPFVVRQLTLSSRFISEVDVPKKCNDLFNIIALNNGLTQTEV
jgi:hypothetical protein